MAWKPSLRRDPEGYDPHSRELCDQFASKLRSLRDPSSGETIRVTRVWAVFPEDDRGLVEVLYAASGGYQYVNGVKQQGSNGEPLTAFLRGNELAYLVEGW